VGGGGAGHGAGQGRVEGAEPGRLAGPLSQLEQRGQRNGQFDLRGNPDRGPRTSPPARVATTAAGLITVRLFACVGSRSTRMRAPGLVCGFIKRIGSIWRIGRIAGRALTFGPGRVRTSGALPSRGILAGQDRGRILAKQDVEVGADPELVHGPGHPGRFELQSTVADHLIGGQRFIGREPEPAQGGGSDVFTPQLDPGIPLRLLSALPGRVRVDPQDGAADHGADLAGSLAGQIRQDK